MHRVGGRDLFAESGKAKELLEKYGMDTKSVYLAAKELLERKKGK
jgi:transketolase C-terminal domain/subunit